MKKVTSHIELIKELEKNGSLAIRNMDAKKWNQAKNEYTKVKLIDVAEFRTSRYAVSELYKQISRVF